jgi:hypothetical protein
LPVPLIHKRHAPPLQQAEEVEVLKQPAVGALSREMFSADNRSEGRKGTAGAGFLFMSAVYGEE